MAIGIMSLPVIIIGETRLDWVQPGEDRRSAGKAQEMSETEPVKPSQANIDKMWNYAEKFAEKSGTLLHPDVRSPRRGGGPREPHRH